MERARTAREAVEIIGELINEHGYSTYGGNSHMFADENEGWVLNFAGGQGLWIASVWAPMTSACPTPATFPEIPLNYAEIPTSWAHPTLSTLPSSKAGSTLNRMRPSTSRWLWRRQGTLSP
ncbi:MAG: hypothetical protein CM15mP103_08440 [Gammaproteobacteria bacterium]|nr:MAG: hypothetical protein CM15mP103_08440 [Gammaproteobacteria bacterium]